jgi:tetratricopeptide (TPR) repeat protein
MEAAGRPSREHPMKVAMVLLLLLGGCTPTAASSVASAPPASGPTARDVVSQGPELGAGQTKTCNEAAQARAEVQAILYVARASDHRASGEYDQAIADETRAIELAPNFPEAYHDRAFDRAFKGDIKGGRGDLVQAITLAPQVPCFYEELGSFDNLLKDHDQALADFDQAIRLAPSFFSAMDAKAKTLFNLGRYDEAAAEFREVIRLTPGDYYPVLWLHIARMRAHEDDSEEYRAGKASLDMTQWPAPIFDLFEGKITASAMRRAADAQVDEGECEGAVFAGQYFLVKDDRPSAMPQVQEAASVCPSSELRRLTSWAELERLAPSARDAGAW